MVTAPASDLQELAQRLGIAVEQAGGRTVVAEVANVPRTTLDRYMRAQSEAPAFTLARIARACSVSLDWLLGRGGDMQVKDGAGELAPTGLVVRMTSDLSLPVPEGFVAVPYLEVRASAGGGRASLPAETVAGEHFLFGQAWLRSLGVVPERAELLQAQGDSMYPTIHDGDLMLVDRGYGEVVHGKIYALVVNGLVVVKRVQFLVAGGMILLSDNDRYPSETIRREEVEQLSFQGRIVWYGRAI